MITDTYWKILDFAKIVDKHYNTVYSWFNKLEERAIHYTNRVGEDKIYDQLDLDIAIYIKEKREQKWAIDAIFDELPNHFELRPFPLDYVFENPQNLDMVTIKREVEKVLSVFAATKLEEIRMQSEQKVMEVKREAEKEIQKLKLQIEQSIKPVNEVEEKQKRLTDHITQKRVEHKLEMEALGIWSQKTESERMVKVGWFRKEEDRDKRDRFVKDYVREHFEQHLKNAYGFE